MQRSYGWQWWAELWGFLRQRLLGSSYSFLSIGGQVRWENPSKCLAWCASTKSSFGASVLGSGVHRTTTAPWSCGTGVLSAAVALVSKVWAYADFPWNQDLRLQWLWPGERGWGCSSSMGHGWQGAVVVWSEEIGHSSNTAKDGGSKSQLRPQMVVKRQQQHDPGSRLWKSHVGTQDAEFRAVAAQPWQWHSEPWPGTWRVEFRAAAVPPAITVKAWTQRVRPQGNASWSQQWWVRTMTWEMGLRAAVAKSQ